MPKVDLEVHRADQPHRLSAAVRRGGAGPLVPAARRRPAGLTDFGVSHVALKPGAWSSQRHWHDGEDEFLVMLTGEAVLVEDDGRTVLRAGDCAAWPKGSTQRPSSAQRERRRLLLHRRRRRHQHGRRLFRHRHDVHGRRQLRPQGRHALRNASRLSGQAASYCSMTQGSSWALSIHSATCGCDSTAFI